MDSNLHLICPVCGNTPSSSDPQSLDCPKCGFENAFVPWFAGEKSRDLWQRSAMDAKASLALARTKKYAVPMCFTASSRAVAFLSPDSHTLYITRGDGTLETEKKVLQYSACERNYAVLYEKGTVKVFGEDNSYGQKNTAGWSGIQAVLSAPNCTYGITAGGSVVVQGSPADPAVKTWKNMKSLVCSANFLVGVQKTGQVLWAGDLPDGAMAERMAAWRNVSQVAAARDCVLALHTDGTVSFAGKPGDPRNCCGSWENALSVCADSAYALALTEEGTPLFAGSCKAFLDRGRSAAAKWTDLMALSCGPSSIAGLTSSGELLFAGTILGDSQTLISLWKEQVAPHIF